jgi:hypothetical protein
MKRWMSVAVAAVAALAGLTVAGPANASSTAWYETLQVNRAGGFSEIAAISDSNIWAVGLVWDKNGNILHQPFIRHYNGSGWAAVTIPGSPSFESDQVSASAANNVWVVGLGPSSVAHSVAYRYDGSHWHKIPVPALTYLQGIAVFGPKNVWAFGSSGTIFPPHGLFSADVFHWNGTKWRGYNLAGGNLMGESISASGKNNVWIAGNVATRSGYRALAFRWNGIGWHNEGLPLVRTDEPGVSVFSPTNVWIGWDTTLNSHAMHWDGQHWHPVIVPDNVDANTSNVVGDGQGGYWFGYASILTGSTWTNEPFNYDFTAAGLGSVVRIPGTESFLMSASVREVGSTIQKPTLYRFDL